jgi:hypothetical protein
MTHNGKIARLPQNLRDELNHRLEAGEPGGRILEWLNTLPPVQTMLAAEFGGVGINAQNLSNWHRGGHQHWLKQQERRSLVRELAENAGELATDAGGVEIGNHLSAMLVAEFAAAAGTALATITDPAERCARQQEFLQTLARVRRQDYLAGRLAIERERRAREREQERRQDEFGRECHRESAPWARQIHRSLMADSFAHPDFHSQAQGIEQAATVLGGLKPGPSDPDPAKSS